MKITPTETDRLAAQLFTPAGGMRAAWRGERNGVRPVWERLRDGSEATPDFYDTDDGPTQGAMLDQIEAAAQPKLDAARFAEDLHLALVSRWRDCKRTGWRVVDDGGGGAFVGPLAETRGAALVAAKRALAEAAK